MSAILNLKTLETHSDVSDFKGCIVAYVINNEFYDEDHSEYFKVFSGTKIYFGVVGETEWTWPCESKGYVLYRIVQFDDPIKGSFPLIDSNLEKFSITMRKATPGEIRNLIISVSSRVSKIELFSAVESIATLKKASNH